MVHLTVAMQALTMHNHTTTSLMYVQSWVVLFPDSTNPSVQVDDYLHLAWGWE